MHGILRFALATLVVLSHLGHSDVFNVGVSAVVVFYMLAGYVVTHLLYTYFPPGRLLAFYVERFLRVYPLYLLFLIAVSAFLLATGFGGPTFTPAKALANLLIIPLNYYMFVDVSVVRGFCVLPPAWSLGAELQAYAVLPLIIRSFPAKWIAGIFSLCIFSAAAFGIIDSDIWGYRLLPGIIFIFLTGSAIYKTVKVKDAADIFDRTFPVICWIWLLVLLLGMVVTFRLPGYSTAAILGFLIGMPIVQFTSTSLARIPLDSVFGRLSYGLFLIHLPVAWALEYFFGVYPASIISFLSVMVISVALSAGASFSVEQIVWSLRKAITKG